MKLWTIQSKKIAKLFCNKKDYYGSWEWVDEFWIESFKEMVREFEARLLVPVGGAPVWAWQSCGANQGPVTVEAAIDLHGSAEELEEYHLYELEVPASRILLSSYALWCKHITCDILPGNEEWKHEFWETLDHQPPELNHPDDSIQAVIDCIKPEWIIDRREIRVVGREDHELI